ncbi:chorismate mutase, partial [Candidatus Pelagibacter sp.]|nr:chorismate mutase [Candidatus Pelagibacter sp.]
MSPLKRKKLSKIRFELDKLDNSLIKIIKKRTILVKKVLALKERKSQIVDHKRINVILRNIKKKSL